MNTLIKFSLVMWLSFVSVTLITGLIVLGSGFTNNLL